MAVQQVATGLIADGAVTSAKLATGAAVANIGAGGITSNELGAAAVTPAKLSQPFTQGTAQNSTSGTAIDFTGIPSWAKRITISLYGVSTNGTSNLQVQVGNGSVVTTGYSSFASYAGGANQSSGAASTTGLLVTATQAAASTVYGVITLVNLSGNNWTHSAVNTQFNGSSYYGGTGNGIIALAGALDRVRITTVNGTDTFDAGSVNILYE